jgi:protein-L-isoaspartate(D-aspartate) O-methyltransferase
MRQEVEGCYLTECRRAWKDGLEADMYQDKWSSRRTDMVLDQLRRRGIQDQRVLAALARVPRERFVPAVIRDQACADRALAIGHGQTISQPFMVGVMTEALKVEPGDRVLEIGTGSGYQAAVLATLGAEVYTVERVPELASTARARLDELGFGDVRVRVDDGSLGWPGQAPFERIVVTAAAPSVPAPLLEQLSPEGGRLVVPVGARDLQDLVVVERLGNERVTEKMLECRFVPLLGSEGWGG